jgi:hypothetical protein
MLGAKLQLGRVLIMSAAAQLDIGLAVFPTAGPRHLVVKLQKVTRSTLPPFPGHVVAAPLIPLPHGTPNRRRDLPTGPL